MRPRNGMGLTLLAAFSLLPACSDAFGASEQRQLALGQARWNAAGFDEYQVEVRLSCFCPASLPVFSRLQVRGDQVVAAEPLTAVPGADAIPLEDWPTVPEVFALIEGASHQSYYSEIEAEYDPTLGYPTRVELRCKEDVLDCGASYELRNLSPLAVEF